jgi:PPM family protein phosphatase
MNVKTKPHNLTGYESGKASNTGLIRANNEDSLLTFESFIEWEMKIQFLGIYAIADGVGGHEDGEVASRLAIKIFAESLIRSFRLPRFKYVKANFTKDSIRRTLSEAVGTANEIVYIKGQKNGCRMATTLVALLIINTTAYIVNVGDSRVYIKENTQFKQITKDDSLVAKLVDAGEITPEEIYSHPQRNIITHCLGTQKYLQVIPATEKLKVGSTLLLCSDGLWEMVRDNEIKNIMAKNHNPQIACKRLVQVANEKGGKDNISVIIVKVT